MVINIDIILIIIFLFKYSMCLWMNTYHISYWIHETEIRFGFKKLFKKKTNWRQIIILNINFCEFNKWIQQGFIIKLKRFYICNQTFLRNVNALKFDLQETILLIWNLVLITKLSKIICYISHNNFKNNFVITVIYEVWLNVSFCKIMCKFI